MGRVGRVQEGKGETSRGDTHIHTIISRALFSATRGMKFTFHPAERGQRAVHSQQGPSRPQEASRRQDQPALSVQHQHPHAHQAAASQPHGPFPDKNTRCDFSNPSLKGLSTGISLRARGRSLIGTRVTARVDFGPSPPKLHDSGAGAGSGARSCQAAHRQPRCHTTASPGIIQLPPRAGEPRHGGGGDAGPLRAPACQPAPRRAGHLLPPAAAGDVPSRHAGAALPSCAPPSRPPLLAAPQGVFQRPPSPPASPRGAGSSPRLCWAIVKPTDREWVWEAPLLPAPWPPLPARGQAPRCPPRKSPSHPLGHSDTLGSAKAKPGPHHPSRFGQAPGFGMFCNKHPLPQICAVPGVQVKEPPPNGSSQTGGHWGHWPLASAFPHGHLSSSGNAPRRCRALAQHPPSLIHPSAGPRPLHER